MFHVKQKRVAFRSPAGACLLCRLPTLPLVCFFAPIPPTPFPRGEGGDFWFSYARGSAPCIPGAEPARHWLFLPRQCFFAPIPPAPLPVGKGDFCFILPGAGAPGTPAAKPGRHWLFLPYQCFPAPIPPTRARRALFPAGRGRFFVLFCRGLAPPAPLLLNLRGAGYAFRTQAHKILSKHPLIRNALVNAYL